MPSDRVDFYIREINMKKLMSTVADFRYTPLLFLCILVVIGYGVYIYLAYYNTYSNDAYVYADIINITPQVSGQISKIWVKDNSKVSKGEKLIQIDPRPYEYAYNLAKANLAKAQVQYDNQQSTIKALEDKLEKVIAQLNLAKDHIKRYTPLINQGAVAKVKLIDLETSVQQNKAAVAQARQELIQAKKQLNDNDLKVAKAKLNQAVFNLEHTTIYATTNGYITNFQLLKGQYLKATEPVFALVDTEQWWVITRYRETSLRLVNVGDKVKIHIDMYPKKKFNGVVTSIGWGINRKEASSEAANSTLTYIKPTENWVRIAQRFPVWIKITNNTENDKLRVGLSANTSIE